MARMITMVLPVEAAERSKVDLAPGLATVAGATLGVVDNGLWRSMRVFRSVWDQHLRSLGAAGIEVTPFDHLAADFADQQVALGPFGKRVEGVVTGMGN
jgi:hypothetical protein